MRGFMLRIGRSGKVSFAFQYVDHSAEPVIRNGRETLHNNVYTMSEGDFGANQNPNDPDDACDVAKGTKQRLENEASFDPFRDRSRRRGSPREGHTLGELGEAWLKGRERYLRDNWAEVQPADERARRSTRGIASGGRCGCGFAGSSLLGRWWGNHSRH